MRLLTFIFAFVCLAFGTSSQAATIVGTSDEGSNNIASEFGLNTGVYLIEAVFGAPISDLRFFFVGEEDYDFFDVVTGRQQGGNTVPTGGQFSFDGPATHFQFIFKVKRPYTVCDATFCQVGYYENQDLFVVFESERGESFSISSTRIGAVPEPSTWVLFILAFAGIGAALRHGNSYRRVASSAL